MTRQHEESIMSLCVGTVVTLWCQYVIVLLIKKIIKHCHVLSSNGERVCNVHTPRALFFLLRI